MRSGSRVFHGMQLEGVWNTDDVQPAHQHIMVVGDLHARLFWMQWCF